MVILGEFIGVTECFWFFNLYFFGVFNFLSIVYILLLLLKWFLKILFIRVKVGLVVELKIVS